MQFLMSDDDYGAMTTVMVEPRQQQKISGVID